MRIEDYTEHLPPVMPPEDVHAMTRHMLSKCPVAHSDQDGGFWLVNRHEDLLRVMQDWKTFETGTNGVYVPTLGFVRPPMAPLEYNPPRQRRVKDIISRFLSPQALKPREDRWREIIAATIDEFAGDGHCDIAVQLAKRFPATILTESLFELTDPGDIERLRYWTHALTYDILKLEPAVLEEIQAEWRGWCREFLEARRQDPRDDLVTALARTPVDEDGTCLSDDEIVGTMQLLLLAGFGTTSDATCSITLRLIQEPGLQELLRENPDMIPAAIEECLRLDPPVSTRPRRPKVDVEVGETKIPAGDRILCNYLGANVDPAAWEDADAFRLDRTHSRAVTFGVGNHRCSGVTMARIELRLMLEELLKRVKDIRWDGDRRETRVAFLATTWTSCIHLPVLFTPLPKVESLGGGTTEV